MSLKAALLLMALAFIPAGMALADELTQIVQQDLVTLGYDPGAVDGNATTKTIIAVSRFQAEHGLEPTGEITPQLAGVIKAAITRQEEPAKFAQPAAAVPGATAQAQPTLEERQKACLQEKVAAAKKSSDTKRGFGKLLRAVSRTSSQFGSGTTAAEISSTASDMHSVNATVADLEGAAKDLGVTESDIEACRNP